MASLNWTCCKPSTAWLQAHAAEHGRSIIIRLVIQENAYTALMACDRARPDELVSVAAAEWASDVDVLGLGRPCWPHLPDGLDDQLACPGAGQPTLADARAAATISITPMTQPVTAGAHPSAASVFDGLPAIRQEPGARERIRASHVSSGRRIAVLDDDPTGSQAVHHVSVVTVLDEVEYAHALDAAGATCFILTNTRSLPAAAAVELTTRVASSLFQLADRLGVPIDIVSRSDSTLRGYVIEEVRAIDAARRAVTGRGFDGIILAPAFFEPGRLTAGDIHWARVGDQLVPVGATEFARDATFGYAASNLREFIAEKSGGMVIPDQVRSISLEDIRLGGPGRVAEILTSVTNGAFVVVNATDYADYEIVVLGLLQAEDAGQALVYRTGPSFVRALAGQDRLDPLTAQAIWPQGHPGGHGLVVVGSHVGLTSRQVAAVQQRGGLTEIELDVARLSDAASTDAHVAETSGRVLAALAESDVLLYTTRDLVRGADADASLEIARTVSTAVTAVVRNSLAARPAWIVAKGGITSHDVAVRGLGIRRAEVLGQLLPGIISVLRPQEAAPEAIGKPYVVFAGNVGDEQTLVKVIDVFSAPG